MEGIGYAKLLFHVLFGESEHHLSRGDLLTDCWDVLTHTCVYGRGTEGGRRRERVCVCVRDGEGGGGGKEKERENTCECQLCNTCSVST